MTMAWLGWLAAVWLAAERPPAPAADCLDARAVTQVWNLAADDFLIGSAGRHFRLRTDGACAGAGEAAQLLAEAGWVCPRLPAWFLRGAEHCPVASIERIPEARARHLLRGAGRRPPATEHLAAAFRGAAAVCLRPSKVRSWSVQGDSLIVSTSALGSGGKQRYRVRLVDACPEAGSRNTLEWRPVTGQDRICGIPGEYVVFSSPHEEVVAATRAFHGPQTPMAELRGCAIAAVEAIDGKE